MNINKTRYWEPGNHGIYFWANMRQGAVKPHLGVATSIPGEDKDINGQHIEMLKSDVTIGQDYNQLAWLCWKTPDNWQRTPNTPAYNPELQ